MPKGFAMLACIALLAPLEGGGVMVCARHSIYSPEKTGTLAVVNKTGAFFDSGFVLGDYMTLECCFKVHAGTSTTGLVLVGYYSGTGINDNKDYRLFLAGSSSSPDMYRSQHHREQKHHRRT